MQGSGVTQPVKFLTNETPLLVFGSQSTYIHTYIYFIYARNLQSSCRANVFEKIS